MTKASDSIKRGRRGFLKTAAAAATAALVAPANLRAQPAQTGEGSTARRPNGSQDRGLWITWYDLPEQGRNEYLQWLHGKYLPALLKRPGYLWAAHYATRIEQPKKDAPPPPYPVLHADESKVPPGYHYILIVGARDASVFANPVPSKLHESLSAQDHKMLAMRAAERINLMTQVAWLEGRSGKTYKDGLTGAPCIQLGSYNCPLENEEEMLAGYVINRLPAQCATASCVRTRKLSSVVGWAKHAILYEYASLEGFERDYEIGNANSPLGFGKHSVAPQLVHAPHGPNSALRLWPPVAKA